MSLFRVGPVEHFRYVVLLRMGVPSESKKKKKKKREERETKKITAVTSFFTLWNFSIEMQ